MQPLLFAWFSSGCVCTGHGFLHARNWQRKFRYFDLTGRTTPPLQRSVWILKPKSLRSLPCWRYIVLEQQAPTWPVGITVWQTDFDPAYCSGALVSFCEPVYLSHDDFTHWTDLYYISYTFRHNKINCWKWEKFAKSSCMFLQSVIFRSLLLWVLKGFFLRSLGIPKKNWVQTSITEF